MPASTSSRRVVGNRRRRWGSRTSDELRHRPNWRSLGDRPLPIGLSSPAAPPSYTDAHAGTSHVGTMGKSKLRIDLIDDSISTTRNSNICHCWYNLGALSLIRVSVYSNFYFFYSFFFLNSILYGSCGLIQIKMRWEGNDDDEDDD